MTKLTTNMQHFTKPPPKKIGKYSSVNHIVSLNMHQLSSIKQQAKHLRDKIKILSNEKFLQVNKINPSDKTQILSRQLNRQLQEIQKEIIGRVETINYQHITKNMTTYQDQETNYLQFQIGTVKCQFQGLKDNLRKQQVQNVFKNNYKQNSKGNLDICLTQAELTNKINELEKYFFSNQKYVLNQLSYIVKKNTLLTKKLQHNKKFTEGKQQFCLLYDTVHSLLIRVKAIESKISQQIQQAKFIVEQLLAETLKNSNEFANKNHRIQPIYYLKNKLVKIQENLLAFIVNFNRQKQLHLMIYV